jgi:hypothetical protein
VEESFTGFTAGQPRLSRARVNCGQAIAPSDHGQRRHKMIGKALTIKRMTATLASAAGVAALVVMAVAASAWGAAGSTAPSFHLVFDGKHNQNLLHEGPFTTSSSFCPSGYATDVSINELAETALRRFTCDNAGGDFTARVRPLRAEHGGTGTWQIVDGSGPLADLRGKGTWTSVRLSTDDFPTFRSTWDGVADLDVAAPTVTIERASASKLPRPNGMYQLRIAISLGDGAAPVSYSLVAVDPRKPFNPLWSKSGQTSTGSVSTVSRVRLSKLTRTLRLRVDANDPFGNSSFLVKSLRLP